MQSIHQPSPFTSRDQLLRWLAAGLRAPSADNVHHVRFRIRGDCVELRADDEYLRCEEAHRRLLMQLSFGAVAENMRLALGEVYRTCIPHWLPDPADPAQVLRFELGRLPSLAEGDPLAAAIDARHTNRGLFRGPAMSTTESDLVSQSIADPGVALHWFDGGRPRSAVLALMRRAEALRFADRRLHRELFESIDFAAGWTASSPERLAPATLGVEAPLRPMFAALRHWPVMRVARGIGGAKMLGLRAGDLPARFAPHIGVIASTLGGDLAGLRAGVQFQRVWLAANGAGLAIQPMVASAVLTRLEDGDPHRDAARDRLRQGWRSLLGEQAPFVVFRLGRAARPPVVSARRPVSDYLID